MQYDRPQQSYYTCQMPECKFRNNFFSLLKMREKSGKGGSRRLPAMCTKSRHAPDVPKRPPIEVTRFLRGDLQGHSSVWDMSCFAVRIMHWMSGILHGSCLENWDSEQRGGRRSTDGLAASRLVIAFRNFTFSRKCILQIIHFPETNLITRVFELQFNCLSS